MSYKTTEEDLKQAFEGFGQVESVKIIKDKYSGESRGFGFVEMPDKAEAESAIEGLNGKELKGRRLNVNEARPRSEGRSLTLLDFHQGAYRAPIIALVAYALPYLILRFSLVSLHGFFLSRLPLLQ